MGRVLHEYRAGRRKPKQLREAQGRGRDRARPANRLHGLQWTPRGTRNCNEGGCPRCNAFVEGGTRLDECLCSHGEENAITQAAYHGVSLRGGSIYTTFCPCLICTKMIINAGIEEVVYNADYPLGEVSLALLREAGVKVRRTTIR